MRQSSLDSSRALLQYPMGKHRDQDESRPYIYTPLPEGDVIRYLSLEPGVDEEPLKCSLHTACITEATYEAISYVWGSDIRNHTITCDDGTLSITTNLFETLRRLRDPTEVRHLWADSICINQNDAEEKGHQVANMSLVYSNASRVLVCLGSDPEGHGPKVASLLKDVYGFLQDEVAKLDVIEWDAFHCEPQFVEDQRWRSFDSLIEQPWFTRGWVVREVALARYALAIWGDAEFSWESLIWVAIWFHSQVGHSDFIGTERVYKCVVSHVDAYLHRNDEVLRVFVSPAESVKSRLLEYLAKGRRLQFTDQRDGIYAFTDLPTKTEDHFRIQPDYAQPLEEVFRDFASRYIQSTGDLTLLNYVMHSQQSIESNFSSWVPRWNSINDDNDDQLWTHVCGNLVRNVEVPKIHVRGGKILRVCGVLLDSVEFAIDLLQKSTVTRNPILELWNSVQAVGRPKEQSKTHQLKALLETLVRGSGRAGHFDRKDLASWVEYLEEICCKARDKDRRMPELAPIFNGKRFIVTKRGYFGLAPAVTRKGDVCTRFNGSYLLPDRCFYLLRATEQPLYYRFVGPGWIHDDDDTILNEQSNAREGTHSNTLHNGLCDIWKRPFGRMHHSERSAGRNEGTKQAKEQVFYLC